MKLPNTNKKSTKIQLYWNTLIRIPVLVVNFAISIVVARILEPKDFGIMGIVMMLVGYANLFTNLGFNQSIVQQNIRDKETLDSIFTIDLVISFFLTTLCFVFSGKIANFFNMSECKSVLQVMSFVFVITSFQSLPHGILRRNMEFKKFSLIEVNYSLCVSLFTLILAFLGFKYWALALGQLIALVLTTIIFAYTAKWCPGLNYKHGLMKSIYSFGFWTFLRVQVHFFSAHIDKFLIGKWIGGTQLGLYDKSKSLAGILNNSILMNINSVMFSKFSNKKLSKLELGKHFKKSLIITSLIVFPVYIGLIIVAPYFVSALLGYQWKAMIFPFQLILLGSIFRSFDGLFTAINVGVGRYKEQSIRMLIAIAVFAIACLLFLRLGLNGIAVGFIIYCIILSGLGLSLCKSSIGTSWIDVIKCVAYGLFLSLIMGILVGSLSLYLDDYTISNLIFLSGFGAIMYTLLFLFIGWNDDVKEIRKALLLDIKSFFCF